MESDGRLIRVGSRKSELALIQTKHVISRLQEVFPNKKFEIHTMTTIGDRVLNISLPKIGEKSLFTRDLEEALRSGLVDFVVHSLKDLPTSLPSGMAIGAVLKREDARDALVLRVNYKGCRIDTLPNGCVIGTSSLRRTAQIRRQYPNLVVCDIRGNLNTRLAKLDADNSKFAGIVLAHAGLVRMGWHDRISQILNPTDLLYAVGQGALAVECRGNDTDILSMLQNLMCLSTACRILAERSFLKSLGAGCSAPVAVYSKIMGNVANDENTTLVLDGAVWSLDGSIEIRDKKLCTLAGKIENRNSNDDICNDEPPVKRSKSSKTCDDSLPVINYEDDVEELARSYNITELMEKHINLAKKCPVVKSQDADQNSPTKACPLSIEIGTDVMGQCPFVASGIKIVSIDEEKSECKPSTSIASKCPYSLKHKENDLFAKCSQSSMDSSAHSKCPFLRRTVKVYDFSDGKNPKLQYLDDIAEGEDNLFCGLYPHACHNRELYAKCDRLGQELAQNLIGKGALDVMKRAQDEINSKS